MIILFLISIAFGFGLIGLLAAVYKMGYSNGCYNTLLRAKNFDESVERRLDADLLRDWHRFLYSARSKNNYEPFLDFIIRVSKSWRF